MNDPIERQAAVEALGDIHPLDYNLQAVLEKIKALPSAKDIMVDDAPTIDAAPVVRCRDCKWYKTMYCKMDRWTDLVTVYVAKKDDYCSYGERRK